MNDTPNPSDVQIETTQTLDGILHQLLNQALVAIGADAGSLMQVANQRGILQIKARLGKPQAGRKAEAVFTIDNTSVAGHVVLTREPYLCTDVETDPFFAKSRSGLNFLSLLSVPIIHHGKVVAVINADAPTKEFFNETHQAILQSVAEKVAAPIAERMSIVEAMAEVGVELTRLPRDGGVGSLLQKIAEVAIRSLGADIVTLYQYVQETGEFLVEGTGPTVAGKIRHPEVMRTRVYPGDVPAEIVRRRESGFFSDVGNQGFLTKDIQREDTPRPRFVEREGIQSMAALLLPYRAGTPEYKDEEVVGVMFTSYRTPHSFNIDELTALATFADHAASVILNARHEEYRRLEQVKMVETIAGSFAHRMAHLAGATQLAAGILSEHVVSDEDIVSDQLNLLRNRSELLLKLADRIVRPFKETGRLMPIAPVDVALVINDGLTRLEAELKDITVRTTIPANLPHGLSVEYQLCEVVYDLMDNAREAMADVDPRVLSVYAHYLPDTNQVEIDIGDTGRGVPEEFATKLFSPGVGTKKDKLGIGLWYGRIFMRASGGDLYLKDTKPGIGTTFTLVIPCVPHYEATAEVPSDKEPRDILIVDDDADYVQQIRTIIGRDKYAIEVAHDYASAVNFLDSYSFKLAILDVALAGGDPENTDGLRLLETIETSIPGTKVIMITGNIGARVEQHEEIAKRASKLVAFVHKSGVTLEGLRQQIAEVF